MVAQTAERLPGPAPLAEGALSGAWRRYRRSPRGALAGGVIVVAVLLALAAPLVAGYDPLAGSADALRPPLTPGHPMGTDHLGRDVWAQLVYGAQVSLTVGILAALSATLIGTAIGAAAGYAGGAVDATLMRIAEFFQTLPRLVLALIVVALFGAGLGRLIFVIAILSWPQTARVVRASFLSLREAPFVDAARVAGMRAGAIVSTEILPNALAPIIVAGSLDVATAILLEAALGFFGLGDPNRVSWGSMLNQAQPYLRQAWWMALFPGLAISLVVLAFNVVGDSLNEALNPRLRDAA